MDGVTYPCKFGQIYGPYASRWLDGFEICATVYVCIYKYVCVGKMEC